MADLHKAAQVSTVICGIGTPISIVVTLYFGLYPTQTAPTPGDAHMVMGTTFAVSLAIAGTLAVVCAISAYFARGDSNARIPVSGVDTKAAVTSGSRLRILDARYGVGNFSDCDVTEFLQGLQRDGIQVHVGNNLIPGKPDPAPGIKKQLTVVYSFAGGPSKTCVRKEDSSLFLPVDDAFIESTAGEYEEKRKKDLQRQFNEFDKQVRELQIQVKQRGPRRFDVGTFDGLVTMLSVIPMKVPVTVKAHQSDTEAWNCAAEISHAFSKSGWSVKSTVEAEIDLVGIVMISDNGKWKYLEDETGNAIELAFRRVGVEISLSGRGDITDGHIEIYVGANL
jgi:hypothetical protein